MGMGRFGQLSRAVVGLMAVVAVSSLAAAPASAALVKTGEFGAPGLTAFWSEPQAAAAGLDGTIYATDGAARGDGVEGYIRTFTPDASAGPRFGGSGSGPGQFGSGSGPGAFGDTGDIAVGPTVTIYVADP